MALNFFGICYNYYNDFILLLKPEIDSENRQIIRSRTKAHLFIHSRHQREQSYFCLLLQGNITLCLK